MIDIFYAIFDRKFRSKLQYAMVQSKNQDIFHGLRGT